MEKFRALLLDVWREACRHIEIAESAEAIAAILGERLPLARVVVRRFDAARDSLETVAAAPAGDAAHAQAHTILPREVAGRLMAWKAGALRGPAAGQRADHLALLVPGAADADVLVAPLREPGRVVGVLALVAVSGRVFTAEHATMFEALLEPFTVALENDERLREMQALREAAEADARSLLARLGRENLVDEIVGADSGLRLVMERVELVSRSDAPVLIFGETGTGKELVARHIHALSARSSGPFLRVNCGAIAPELIDSELFGHERGSFTGAVASRKGWFERADEGTLFLDEIGELPPPAQVRLLNVLQDGRFDRVGGQEQVKVDVRVVAATHRDLSAMVREGEFREDLWYRIAVFPLALPPLRNRTSDIPALARHFAKRAATRFGLRLQLPSVEDLTLLLAYDWPGNIRELATVIERAALLGDGRGLEVRTALGVSGAAAPPRRRSGETKGATAVEHTGHQSLATAVRRHIEAALAATSGRIEGPRGAAVLLDVNPHTLRARMRKLGIDWAAFRQRRHAP